jgi:hypothetical protein
MRRLTMTLNHRHDSQRDSRLRDRVLCLVAGFIGAGLLSKQ